jgi:hypothetical protein
MLQYPPTGLLVATLFALSTLAACRATNPDSDRGVQLTDTTARTTTDTGRDTTPATTAGFDVRKVVDSKFPLCDMPLVIDRDFLDAHGTPDSAMAPSVVDALGVMSAWHDSSFEGQTTGVRTFDHGRNRFYPICRFASPDSQTSFLIIQLTSGAGGIDDTYLLTPFPASRSDSATARVIALARGDAGFSEYLFCRIEYPTITMNPLLLEYETDTDKVKLRQAGRQRVVRIGP